MKKKYIIGGVLVFAVVAVICSTFMISGTRKEKEVVIPVKEEKSAKKAIEKPVHKPNLHHKKVEKNIAKAEVVKKVEMYSDNNILPLSAVVEIANLSDLKKKNIHSILENSNLYYIESHKDKLFMIVGNEGNEKYQRHDIEFIELNSSGHKKVTKLGDEEEYVGDNDEWEFDENSNSPLKHVKYNSNGEVEYTEIWNYDPQESIKYEKQDGNGNVLSIKKETPDGDTNVRIEHLIYDENGKTKINVSANYEGPDITRFTYFDADKPQEGITLMSTYEDGVKTKEVVYSSSYKIKNTYEAEYKDGERVNIKVLDDENNVVEEISAQ